MLCRLSPPTRSSSPVRLGEVTRPFPGEREADMTDRARLDRALSEGEVPEQLALGSRGRFQERLAAALGWSGESIRYHIQPDLIRSQKKLYHRRLKLSTAGSVGLGAIFGGSLVWALTAAPLGALAGAAVGAALGLVHGIRAVRSHFQGQVQVEHDGLAGRSQYFEDTDSFHRSADQWRSYLYSRGELGDSLTGQPAPFMDGEYASLTSRPAILAASAGPSLAEQLRSAVASADPGLPPELRQLGEARRLAADRGHRSLYGHGVLDLVDANQAHELLRQGQTLFVVSGRHAADIPHYYSEQAGSPDRKVKARLDNEYLERRFEYGLTPVKSLGELKALPPAPGVPPRINAVYARSDHLSEFIHLVSERDGRTTSLDGQGQSRWQGYDRIRRY